MANACQVIMTSDLKKRSINKPSVQTSEDVINLSLTRTSWHAEQ